MPTCFLVLGTPRSGNSLVAGVLHHLGIRMGEYLGKEDDGITDRWDWCGPDEWNGKGHFQDAAFVNFGTAVFGWPATNPRRLTAREKTALSAIIDQRTVSRVDWGVCEPMALAFYLRDFIELCPDQVKLLATERQAIKSIQSWRDRSGHSVVESTALIESVDTEVRARRAAAGLPSLTVQFNDLIDHTERTVQEIATFVGKPVNQAATNFPDASLRNY